MNSGMDVVIDRLPKAITIPAKAVFTRDGKPVVALGGTGMDEETRKHIFEPFFTTKGPTQGSGLGLATVYGIVKQSHGWIEIYTELGKGSAFKIYLPRTNENFETRADAEHRRANVGGSETVLLVEDQDEVRHLATKVLEAKGYRVLEAADGAAALALVQRHPGPIDLLLTDVVMPGMNGRELAEYLKKRLPVVKVLYTSGYTHDVIAHRGVLDRRHCEAGRRLAPERFARKRRQACQQHHDEPHDLDEDRSRPRREGVPAHSTSAMSSGHVPR